MNQNLKDLITDTVEKTMPDLLGIRQYLYDHPEIGGTEALSSRYLIGLAEKYGFELSTPILDVPYSFRACADSGRPGPSVGVMAEFDALPEIGHGCGHNLIAAMSFGAAIALKEVICETGGRVILYGTPAEENFVPKRKMSQEGVFREIDIALMAHPAPKSQAGRRTYGLDAWQVEFYGRSSHAGAQPELGINALDAAVMFYQMIGFEKQYYKDTNVYGVFVDGGEKCSVIPDHASVKYLARALRQEDLERLRDLFDRCARAACLATGCTYKIWANEPPSMAMNSNEVLSDLFAGFYEEVTGIPLSPADTTGSTDMGDVSHVVPAIHPWIGIGCPELQLHSAEFREQTMTEAGAEAIRTAAKALAFTGAEVLADPELLLKIQKSFKENV